MPTEKEVVAQILAKMDSALTLADGLDAFIVVLLERIQSGATIEDVTQILENAQSVESKLAASLGRNVPGVEPNTP